MLSFDIPPENPTETPSISTPEPSSTPSPTDMPTATPTLTPTPEGEVLPPPRGAVNLGDWLAALIITAGMSGGNYWFASRKIGIRWGVRGALLALIGGLFAYTYLAVSLPGSESLIQSFGVGGVVVATFLGALIGAGAVWAWYALDNRPTRSSSTN